MRKVAANYICLPGKPLVKNGYVVLKEGMPVEVVDTGGVVTEIAGLEFYGGMLVADYICGKEGCFAAGEPLADVLGRLYGEGGRVCGIAIIEGADLRRLEWKTGARVRKL